MICTLVVTIKMSLGVGCLRCQVYTAEEREGDSHTTTLVANVTRVIQDLAVEMW